MARLIEKLILTVSLLGCSQPITGPAESSNLEFSSTNGVFSQADEDVYQHRFLEMVKAFQSGKATTNYDTEILFGQDLEPSLLLRGEPKTLSPELIEKVNAYARERTSDSMMIFEKGRVVSESYFGDITAQSLINSKSLAKPLGVIAVGRAIEKGFLSLDQSASDFIIEWKDTDKEAIKIRYLLDMRSGLLPQGFDPGVESVLNRAYLHPKHTEVIIHEYPLVQTPGSRYDYSNANSELVSVIIERATGVPYQEWLTREVLAPLGASGGKIWMNSEGGTAHSGCCIGLASETYLKLGVLILQEGQWQGTQLLSPDFIAQMLTPTPQNKYAGMGVYLGRDYKKNRGAGNPDATSGFGDTLHSEPYLDKDIALFDGNGHQVVYIMPSREIVIMRLGPRPKNKKVWDNSFIPNTVSRSLNVE